MCNGVSGNGNACAQAARREPKMCTQFAIGLTQQLPHLSNLLLWIGLKIPYSILIPFSCLLPVDLKAQRKT